MAYLEFTCGEATEHFLACHQNALEFFGGTPASILIDNLKTGVLEHRFGQRAVFNPRYLDFAAHYGFEPRACTVRKADERGRVENFVGYVKKNLLAGLYLPHSLSTINTADRHWLGTIANVRDHKETRQQPAQLFAAAENPALRPLPPVPADISFVRTVRVTNRCRVVLDTDRYSVPHLYASQQLTIQSQAYSSQYIENILEQRARHTPTPGPLHLHLHLPAAPTSSISSSPPPTSPPTTPSNKHYESENKSLNPRHPPRHPAPALPKRTLPATQKAGDEFIATLSGL